MTRSISELGRTHCSHFPCRVCVCSSERGLRKSCIHFFCSKPISIAVVWVTPTPCPYLTKRGGAVSQTGQWNGGCFYKSSSSTIRNWASTDAFTGKIRSLEHYLAFTKHASCDIKMKWNPVYVSEQCCSSKLPLELIVLACLHAILPFIQPRNLFYQTNKYKLNV